MRTALAALALVAVASCTAWTSAAPAPAAATTAATWHTEHSGTTRTLYDAGCLTAWRCFAVGDAGTLLATTDGGRTWRHEKIPAKPPLYRVACALPASCYVIARPSTIWVTHDAGSHWAARTLPVHVPGLALPGCVVGDASSPQGETPCRLGLLDISCPSARTCYAVATNPAGFTPRPLSKTNPGPGSSLWLTRNGGATWTRQPIPSGVRCDGDCTNARYGYPLEWVSCAPDGPCWAGGNQLVGSHEGFASALLVAPAPGRPWRLQPGCPASGACSEPVTDLGACPASNLCYTVNNSSPFADGSTVIIYTATGRQGPAVTVPNGLVINGIACPGERTCYTAGTKGTITRTANGTRFVPVKAPARENLNGITCVSPCACYAVGAAGTIEALRAG
jgi:photosynthesis system II assembly factor YCF48-like protein